MTHKQFLIAIFNVLVIIGCNEQSNITKYRQLLLDGNLLAEKGKDEQAIQAYSKAITIFPDSFRAFQFRGIVENKIGKYKEALNDLNKTILLNSKNSLTNIK